MRILRNRDRTLYGILCGGMPESWFRELEKDMEEIWKKLGAKN